MHSGDQIIILQQNDQNNQPIATQQMQPVEKPDEELVEEINMEDQELMNLTNGNNNPDQTKTNNLHYQYSDTLTNNVLGEDISAINHYGIRNRKIDPTNPFFVTNKPNYKLGTLSVSVSGNNKKEQQAFVANILKLPSNSSLINIEFINGNLWITANFEYESDLIFCKDKIDKKNKDLLDLIQLPGEMANNKTKQEGKLKPTKKQNILNELVTKSTNTKTQIQYKTTEKKETTYKGEASTKDISGNNRKGKINFLGNVTDLDSNNSPNSALIHKDNEWTLLTEQVKIKENHNKSLEEKMVFADTGVEQQTYRIRDIPKEYPTNRIKGALKPYGKVIKISTIKNTEQKKEKEIQVTIEPNKNSRNLKELWSIPIGSIMVRVISIEESQEVWTKRN